MSAHDPVKYQEQKADGSRDAAGNLKLKALSPLHMEVVKSHLDGVKNCDIAAIFNMHNNTVSKILKDPLVEAIRKEWMNDKHAEFNALYGKAIDAIRDGLNENEPVANRLKAVDKFFANAPGQKEAETERDTAEDVVARLLQVNIQINNGEVVQ